MLKKFYLTAKNAKKVTPCSDHQLADGTSPWKGDEFSYMKKYTLKNLF
jgi:hypothetical protein